MLICLSASHKNAAFDVLERLSVNAEHAAPRILGGHDALKGAVVVSTCNRFEAYLDLDTPEGASPVDAVHNAIRAVGTVAGLEPEELRSTFDLVTQVSVPAWPRALRLRVSSQAKRAIRSAPLRVTSFTANRPSP